MSDTPTLAEILSSPEIVQILCELRNTAALMTNEKLFQAFADQLGKSYRKFPFYKEFQGPADYLKQYRRNLIQEFFDTLKTEAEMRLFVVPVDPNSELFRLAATSPVPSTLKSSDRTYTNINLKLSGTSIATTKTEETFKSLDSDGGTKSSNKVQGMNQESTFSKPQILTGANADTQRPAAGNDNAKKQDPGDTSARESASKDGIFTTADYIPTSKGYMKVEDWNSG